MQPPALWSEVSFAYVAAASPLPMNSNSIARYYNKEARMCVQMFACGYGVAAAYADARTWVRGCLYVCTKMLECLCAAACEGGQGCLHAGSMCKMHNSVYQIVP